MLRGWGRYLRWAARGQAAPGLWKHWAADTMLEAERRFHREEFSPPGASKAWRSRPLPLEALLAGAQSHSPRPAMAFHAQVLTASVQAVLLLVLRGWGTERPSALAREPPSQHCTPAAAASPPPPPDAPPGTSEGIKT